MLIMCICVTLLVADYKPIAAVEVLSKKIIFGIVYMWRDTKMWGDANHVSLAKQKIFDD